MTDEKNPPFDTSLLPKDLFGETVSISADKDNTGALKSLSELINEGLHNKLYRMPSDARLKLQETIERIINEGCGGLICIIL